MASLVSVRFNLDAALKQLGLSVTRATTIGCMRALNKTAASEQVAMGRAIAADLGIKVSTAKEAMRVEKATTTNLSARLVARGKQIPLIQFSANGPQPSRGKGAGVSYRIGSQGRKRIASGFITTVGIGRHRGVFVRASVLKRKSAGAWSKNLPIEEKFGPSIAHVFSNLLPAGEQRRQEVLLKNLTHEIQFALSQSA